MKIHQPNFWMRETTGVLRPAIESFLEGGDMSPEHVAAMRAYLRQWINAPFWGGDAIEELREAVDGLTSREAIDAWIKIAVAEGIDPL